MTSAVLTAAMKLLDVNVHLKRYDKNICCRLLVLNSESRYSRWKLRMSDSSLVPIEISLSVSVSFFYPDDLKTQTLSTV